MTARLFTGTFWALFAVHFLVTMTFLVLMAFTAGYAHDRFGADELGAGLATGCFVLGGVVARLAVGQRIDAFGRRRALLWSLVVMLATGVASFFAGGLELFIAIRSVQGVAFGIATNVTNAAAMDLMPEGRRGEGTGWFTLAVTLSHALGPFTGLVLAQAAGAPAVLATAAGFTGAALVLTLAVRGVARDVGPERPVPAGPAWTWARVVEPAAAPLALVAALGAAGYTSVLSYLGAYAREEGFAEWAPVYFLVYAACLVIVRPVAGRALDRFGANPVMLPAFACYLAGLGVLAIMRDGPLVLAAAALLAAGYGTLISAGQAIALRDTPRERTSVAISTYYTGLDAGTGFGPLAVGAVIAAAGFRGMYGWAAALIAATLALYWLLAGRRLARAA